MDTRSQLTAALAGRYEIEREIGLGGMATVYLARDARHDRKVALKVLKPDLTAVLGGERFLSEIRVTAQLQHPNLLPLFDSGEAEGLLYYVMPYVDGESLRARLQREKQLPVDEAVRLAVAIANALDYAHRHGVIHRDLKPENILLHEGQPLVADFGIALAVANAGGARITQTGISLGTPQYMSPEQATGDRVIDARTDIYSLAAVLYEMLAGDPPHTGSTVQAIFARLLTDRPRSVRAARDMVPEHVDRAIEQALAKLPADRWASAHEFAEALQGRITNAPGVGTRAAGARRRPAIVRVATHRVPWPAAFVVAGAAVAWAWASGHRDPPDRAVHVTIALGPNQTLSTLYNRTIAIAPDGMTIVYATSDTSPGTLHAFARRLDEETTHIIPGTAGALQPFFSPDGKSIAFSVGSELRRIALEGGTATPLADLASGVIAGGTWGPRDIVISLNDKLSRLPIQGGTPRPVGSPDSAREVWPLFLADGRTVLYGRETGRLTASRIAAVDIASGKRTVFELAGSTPLGVVDGTLVYGRPDGAIMGVSFDERRLRVTGLPTVLLNAQTGASFAGEVKAALSPSGSLAYVTGLADVQPVLANGETTTPLGPSGPFLYPRFSPDGKRIALTRLTAGGQDIWIYETTSGALTRLTTEGTINERAEWSPDGKRVLYRSDRMGRLGTIWWQPWDGSGPAELLLSVPNKDILEAVLSPDGHTIVYRTGVVPNADVWYRRLDPSAGDTSTKALANTPFSELGPRISPDGRWVAYQSNETGTAQVYVRPFPASGPRTQVSVGAGGMPVWSRDGRRLYYGAGGDQILAADVTTGPAFAVTARHVVLSGMIVAQTGHPSYDASPDGKGILVLRPKGPRESIVVVHGWKYELARRLAGTR